MTPCNNILGERNGKNTPYFLFDFAYTVQPLGKIMFIGVEYFIYQ